MMEIQLIMTACVVILGLTSAQPQDQMAHQAVVDKNGYEIREEFQNLFDSMAHKDTRQSKIYREILNQEVMKRKQAFNSIKEGLQIMQNRNSYNQQGFYQKSNPNNNILVIKRETDDNDPDATTDEIYDSTTIGQHDHTLDDIVHSSPSSDERDETTTEEYIPNIPGNKRPYASLEKNVTRLREQFQSKYTNKTYKEWPELHRATADDLNKVCLKFTCKPVRVIPVKNYNEEYFLLRYHRQKLYMDVLTCEVILLDDEGKEFARLEYDLCEGDEPDTAFKFTRIRAWEKSVNLLERVTKVWAGTSVRK